MSRAQNRHDTAKWKKKGHDSRYKCGKAKCSICHPHKKLGGNHAGRVKKKYTVYLFDARNGVDLIY